MHRWQIRIYCSSIVIEYPLLFIGKQTSFSCFNLTFLYTFIDVCDMRINMNNIMQWQYVWLKISSNQDIEQAPTMRTIKGNTEFVVVVHHYKQVIGLRILIQSNFFLLKCLCFIILFKSSSWTATNLYLYLHSKKQAEKKNRYISIVQKRQTNFMRWVKFSISIKMNRTKKLLVQNLQEIGRKKIVEKWSELIFSQGLDTLSILRYSTNQLILLTK